VSEDQLRNMVDNGEDLTYVVTSKVFDFSFLFKEKNLNGDISTWDTSNVTKMNQMFLLSEFNQDISHMGCL
jgi:surface protein